MTLPKLMACRQLYNTLRRRPTWRPILSPEIAFLCIDSCKGDAVIIVIAVIIGSSMNIGTYVRISQGNHSEEPIPRPQLLVMYTLFALFGSIQPASHSLSSLLSRRNTALPPRICFVRLPVARVRWREREKER